MVETMWINNLRDALKGKINVIEIQNLFIIVFKQYFSETPCMLSL